MESRECGSGRPPKGRDFGERGPEDGRRPEDRLARNASGRERLRNAALLVGGACAMVTGAMLCADACAALSLGFGGLYIGFAMSEITR